MTGHRGQNHMLRGSNFVANRSPAPDHLASHHIKANPPMNAATPPDAFSPRGNTSHHGQLQPEAHGSALNSGGVLLQKALAPGHLVAGSLLACKPLAELATRQRKHGPPAWRGHRRCATSQKLFRIPAQQVRVRCQAGPLIAGEQQAGGRHAFTGRLSSPGAVHRSAVDSVSRLSPAPFRATSSDVHPLPAPAAGTAASTARPPPCDPVAAVRYDNFRTDGAQRAADADGGYAVTAVQLTSRVSGSAGHFGWHRCHREQLLPPITPQRDVALDL